MPLLTIDERVQQSLQEADAAVSWAKSMFSSPEPPAPDPHQGRILTATTDFQPSGIPLDHADLQQQLAALCTTTAPPASGGAGSYPTLLGAQNPASAANTLSTGPEGGIGFSIDDILNPGPPGTDWKSRLGSSNGSRSARSAQRNARGSSQAGLDSVQHTLGQSMEVLDNAQLAHRCTVLELQMEEVLAHARMIQTKAAEEMQVLASKHNNELCDIKTTAEREITAMREALEKMQRDLYVTERNQAQMLEQVCAGGWNQPYPVCVCRPSERGSRHCEWCSL